MQVSDMSWLLAMVLQVCPPILWPFLKSADRLLRLAGAVQSGVVHWCFFPALFRLLQSGASAQPTQLSVVKMGRENS